MADRHTGGYCGNCLRFYTRKENWLKHFKQKHVSGIKGTEGYAVNICFELSSDVPRVWEKTKEQAKNKLQEVATADKFFKRKSNEKDQPQNLDSKKLKTNEVEVEHGLDDFSDEDNSNSDIVDKSSNETNAQAQINLDQVMSLLNDIRETQLNNTSTLHKLEGKTNDSNNSGKKNSDDNVGKTIEPDKHFTESMLSLKFATSMHSLWKNDLVKDDFDIRELDVDGDKNEYELYCLGCSDKSLRGLQGRKQRATSFKVVDPDYNQTPDSLLAEWFSNLKLALRRHIAHINHHQLTTSYKMLKTRQFQSTSTIKRLRLNLMYFIMRTNSPFTLYPVLLAVLSRCGQEVGNKNSSRFTVAKVLDLLGKPITSLGKPKALSFIKLIH